MKKASSDILEDEKAKEYMTKMRGLLGDQEIKSENSSSSSSSSEISEEGEEEESDEEETIKKWGAGYWAANPEEQIDVIGATERIAVVDMDWTNIRASDIFVLCSSILPNTSGIKSVTIYYSDYGLDRIPKEATLGLSAFEVYDKKTIKETENDNDNENGDFKIEKLRRYELSKLRYFYAVIECDDVEIAKKIVRFLDGSEFELSQCVLDLRYIPNNIKFEDRPILDKCNKKPVNYEGTSFEYKAMQRADLQCTWDEDDAKDVKVVKRRFKEDELDMQDFGEYIATESELSSVDEEDEEYQKHQKESRKRYLGILKPNNKTKNKIKKTKDWHTELSTSGNSSDDNEKSSNKDDEDLLILNNALENDKSNNKKKLNRNLDKDKGISSKEMKNKNDNSLVLDDDFFEIKSETSV